MRTRRQQGPLKPVAAAEQHGSEAAAGEQAAGDDRGKRQQRRQGKAKLGLRSHEGERKDTGAEQADAQGQCNRRHGKVPGTAANGHCRSMWALVLAASRMLESFAPRETAGGPSPACPTN